MIKAYSVLTTHFHHIDDGRYKVTEKYGLCFDAVAITTQLKIVTNKVTFCNEVEYDVNYF